ncbi:TetR-like C-terminal domain-containing protein [Streptococcus parasanguinis]|uniref:TetR-like C-terminal domain-containing protein n=1 Tax=Streptococcus parasanguinis TaxID=1318 RepID=UPI001E560496|nr:TetR-like C-terminal domain-containing protein [Streptococcus parasanguinis]
MAAYQMPERYAITMYVSGLTGLIVDWIINGTQENPQQLTKIILDSPGMEWFKEK